MLALAAATPILSVHEPPSPTTLGYLIGPGVLLIATGALLWLPRGRRLLDAWLLPPDGAEQPWRALWLTLGFGLLTAVFELAARRVRIALGPLPSEFGPQVWWMVPLVDLILFLLLGGVLATVAALRWPRLGSPRAVVFAGAFLAALGLLSVFSPRLHLAAIPILAAGLASTMARFAGSQPARFHARARRAVPVLAVIVALGALIAVAGGRIVERRARASLPLAPAGAPNVLLIVLDTVRAANLSLYGYGRETSPALERFSRNGVVFDQAYSTAPWTLPTHASLFTGRLPHDLSADVREPLDDTYPTLAEQLAARGYLTGGIAANPFYTGPHSGLSRGFLHYDPVRTGPGAVLLSASLGRLAFRSVTVRNHWPAPGRKRAVRVTDDFLEWAAEAEGRPYFAFLNYFDAHEPYHPPPPFHRVFSDPPPRGAQRDASINTRIDAYDGCLAYLDSEIGRLLSALERRGHLDETLVVITSDHGEAFREHGTTGHGNHLYRPTLHVPLMIVYPGHVPANRRVTRAVSLRDVPATMLELTGSGRSPLPGQSLAREWSPPVAGRSPDEAAPRVHAELSGRPWFDDSIPVSRGDMRSLLTDRYHFIVNGDGREELYDYQRDPWEQTDLAASADGMRQRALLRAALARHEAEL